MNFDYESALARSHVMQLAETTADYLRTKDNVLRKEFFANLDELLSNKKLNTPQHHVAHEVANFLERQPKRTHKLFFEHLDNLLESKDEEE